MVLALTVLLGTQLATTISLAVPGDNTSEGMSMVMLIGEPAGSTSHDCSPCKNTNDATLMCMPACGLSALPPPAVIALKAEPVARMFDQPANKSAEGARHPPDPHPPKATL